MEATLDHWEENEEAAGIDLRGRLPSRNGNKITHGDEGGVYNLLSSSEGESFSGDEDAEDKGSPRNGHHFVSDKNGGAESRYGIFGFNGEDVDSIISKKSFGNEIVTSEVESLGFEKTQKGAVVAKHQDEDLIKLGDEEVTGSGLSVSEQSIQQNNGHYGLMENGKAENGKVKLRDISEPEVSELILERVYEKPAAHDFYCPNCKSCITKVLIRSTELENVPEPIPLPEPIESVRCASCFSFLIPEGSWFFPKAVAKEDKTEIDQEISIETNVGASRPSRVSDEQPQDQSVQVASVVKGSSPTDSVGPSRTNLVSRTGVELPVSLQDSNGTMYDKRSSTPTPSVGISEVVSVDKAPAEPFLERRVGVELPVSLQDSNGTMNGKRSPRSDQPVALSQVLLVDKAPEPDLESQVGVEQPVSLQDSNGTFYDKRPQTPAQLIGIGQDSNATLYDQSWSAQSDGANEAAVVDKAPVSGDYIEASINGVQLPVPSYDSDGTLYNQKSPLPGQSVVSITVTTQSPAPQTDDAGSSESKPREITTITVRSDGQPLISEPRDAKSIDVVKSIVYGGLAEVIASLSIVTSAASAGTATVNILALALANLLGGLFIIGHNLWELKADQSTVTSSRTNEQVDRYEEVLGKKENFILHATVAILSFLIFGLVPPLVYCFSFRQSNDINLKIAVVAASSLLCIVLLATGKAYTQSPQKYIKTLVYYIIIGIGVGGVSYLAGELIEKLVENLGWFSTTVAGSQQPLLQMSMTKPSSSAWQWW